MKQHIVYSLLASLLLMQSVAPYALAQTGEAQTANDTPTADEIQVARSSYTQHEDIANGSGDGQAPLGLSQSRRGAPVPPQVRYPRAGGYGMWQHHGNRRHALIGAVIGFGVGFAIGEKGSKNLNGRDRATMSILFGSAGAMIGAAVGASHP